jgi:hypothetical protein
MALYTVTTGKVVLTAAATKTLILVNPATVAVKLRKVVVSLDASAAAAGVQFDLVRATTLGSPAGTSTTPQQTDERDGAATSTALTVLTTEPTTYAVIDSEYLQPLGGLLPDWQPFGAEGLVTKLAGQRIGLRYTTPSGVTPDCVATFYIEE